MTEKTVYGGSVVRRRNKKTSKLKQKQQSSGKQPGFECRTCVPVDVNRRLSKRSTHRSAFSILNSSSFQYVYTCDLSHWWRDCPEDSSQDPS